MKRFYVAKGETVKLAELHTELVIVDGALKVAGNLTAKHIQGHGYVEAEEILCDTSTIATIRAQIVTAQKVIAGNLLVRDCRAEEIVVTDFFESLHVQANKLTMSRSQLESCEVKEVITLPQKKRGVLGMLLASWWRSLWLPKKTTAKATPSPDTSATKKQKSKTFPPLTDELISALADELERRRFLREQPEPSFIAFGKEDVA